MNIARSNPLRGDLTVPGDKSISHRSIMLGSLARGTTTVTGFLQGADCLSSIACFRQMGIEIENDQNTVKIHGKGLHGLSRPTDTLDTGNSGTTTRLMSGILAAQPFDCTINGDASIQSRPMNRIITPLSMMGAHIQSVNNNGCAPLHIIGGPLKGIAYTSPVASAQVKSAVLLAGLYAQGETSVTEPFLSRDHTERMLRACGADITCQGTTARIHPARELYACDIHIPGDISSAAYFIAAGLIVPGSEIRLHHVGINPTRDGILKVCRDMGADIVLDNEKELGSEPAADIIVRSSKLHGTTIGGSIIPTLIDELPIIAILACFAEGTTIIKDAQELKVKESNRIDIMVENLKAMGADITATEDGMIIHGGRPLHGAAIATHRDHRVAMSFAVAGLASDGVTRLDHGGCVDISYPGFFEDLKKLAR